MDRLEFLTKENHALNQHKGELIEKVWALEAENARLRKALEFYADEIHYDSYFSEAETCDVTEDGGYIAREALQNGEG